MAAHVTHALEFAVFNPANADSVHGLLNGRIGLNLLDFFVRAHAAAKPLITSADFCRDMHHAACPGMHGDIPGAGNYIEIHVSVDLQRFIKAAGFSRVELHSAEGQKR